MVGPKVVSIKGAEVRPPFEPVPSVVAFFEDALEKARAGEIVGVVAAFTHGDETTSAGIKGENDRSTLGMIEMIKHDLCDMLRDDGRG